MVFQMMFAIITVALISGAISDRAKFAGWLLFAFGWATLVYFPVAHWVWGGGFIGAKIHALDFAGGTAVHINAGAAALGLALVLGKRIGWPRESFKPHNVPFVALGAGLLWFGWFGFNAGSELTVDGDRRPRVHQHPGRHGGRRCSAGSSSSGSGTASRPWSAPRPAPSPAWSRITPACGFIAPLGGRRCSASSPVSVCALAVSLKYKLGYDDSLDVVGVHFVGGWIGSLSIGFFATTRSTRRSPTWLGASDGLFYGGGVDPARPAGARPALIVTVYSFVIACAASPSSSRRRSASGSSAEAEVEGIDVAEHAESALRPVPGRAAAAAARSRWPGSAPGGSARAAPSRRRSRRRSARRSPVNVPE